MAKTRRSATGSDEGDCCGTDCCSAGGGCCGAPAAGCCQVEAVVSVDGRGQLVLPKEVREKFGIRPDTKLAVAVWNRGGEACCLTLLKADELAEGLRKAYGPMLNGLLRP